jgi:hypothetical protein
MPRNRPTMGQVLRRLIVGTGPLKRTSDRLECLARIVLAVVLLSGVAVALAVATATASHERSQVLAETAERHQVSAVLTEDAVAVYEGSDGVRDVGQATAVWTGPSGAEHRETISVPPGTAAGSHHTIWIDDVGNRTTRPLDDADVAARSVGYGLVTYLWIALVAYGAYRWIRWVLDRSRSHRWAAEWAHVEPVWTGKVP